MPFCVEFSYLPQRTENNKDKFVCFFTEHSVIKTSLRSSTVATAHSNVTQPLAGYGNLLALGGDAKNSEDAV